MSHVQYIDNTYLEMLGQSVLRDRKIWVNEVVDEISMTKLIYWLEKLENLDKQANVKKPIEIVCNSPGGLCYQGFMAISKIETMVENGYEIITTTGGMSASMSFLLGLVGSKRRGMKYSSFLCHQPSGGMIGEAIKFKREADELDRLWELSKMIIRKHTKMDDELLNIIYKEVMDFTIDSNKALELGVIDEII